MVKKNGGRWESEDQVDTEFHVAQPTIKIKLIKCKVTRLYN